MFAALAGEMKTKDAIKNKLGEGSGNGKRTKNNKCSLAQRKMIFPIMPRERNRKGMGNYRESKDMKIKRREILQRKELEKRGKGQDNAMERTKKGRGTRTSKNQRQKRKEFIIVFVPPLFQ